jgi:hypothetical protein
VDERRWAALDLVLSSLIRYQPWCRRDLVSSGRAAELLEIPRLEFVQRASELGIPTSASLNCHLRLN